MMHGMAGSKLAYHQELAAKQAMEDQAYCTSSDHPREVAMGQVSRVLEVHGDRLSDLLANVALFLERFYGPQPEAGCPVAGAPTPQSPGMLPEIERHLNRHSYLIEELSQKIRRLGDIA